jgi:hypothetical protein
MAFRNFMECGRKSETKRFAAALVHVWSRLLLGIAATAGLRGMVGLKGLIIWAMMSRGEAYRRQPFAA